MKKAMLLFVPLLFFIPIFFAISFSQSTTSKPISLQTVTDLSNEISLNSFTTSQPSKTNTLEENKAHSQTTYRQVQDFPLIDHPQNANSQIKILETDLYDAEFKYEKIKNELATLSSQKETLISESQTYVTDLQKNYLQKLTNIKNAIAKQPLSESHPQIKTNGVLAVDTMIQMILSYTEDPNNTDYKTLGEVSLTYINTAFTDVDLNNTIAIVKYLTSAGNGQTTIGLKLKDAQSIANKFLEEYGKNGTVKGDAYRLNKKQQLATVNVMEIEIQELDSVALEISGIRQQLEEIIQ